MSGIQIDVYAGKSVFIPMYNNRSIFLLRMVDIDSGYALGRLFSLKQTQKRQLMLPFLLYLR